MRDFMTDGRISIRKYRLGDEFALYEGVSELIVELTRWGFYHVGFTMEDAVNDVVSRITTWTEGKIYTFLIEELPGRVFVGNCKIEELEPEINHASLGWWVRSSKTGKGIATAAGRLVAQAAFEELQFALSASIQTPIMSPVGALQKRLVQFWCGSNPKRMGAIVPCLN